MSFVLDIDECQSNSRCAHECKNIIGSYTCSCRSGFQLGSDGFSCHGITNLFAFIYVFPIFIDIWYCGFSKVSIQVCWKFVLLWTFLFYISSRLTNSTKLVSHEWNWIHSNIYMTTTDEVYDIGLAYGGAKYFFWRYSQYIYMQVTFVVFDNEIFAQKLHRWV